MSRPYTWREPERPFAEQADRIQFLEKGRLRKRSLWDRIKEVFRG